MFRPDPTGQLYRLLLWMLALAWVVAGAQAAGTLSLAVRLDPSIPPGVMVDVGGYKLHILCRGDGPGPSVILDAGLGGFSMDWMFVQEQLAAEARVCAYDRAGYGWSEPGPSPRVTEQIAEELDALLQGVRVPPPYVLVGHSFGGYNMEYFAATHPAQTAGLVLVDASHPDQVERLPSPPGRPQHRQGGTLVTFFDPREIYSHFPEEMWYVMAALMASAKAMATQQREFTNFAVSAAQVKSVGPLPLVPLIVVTRGRRVWPDTPLGDSLEQAWAELQSELAASIPGGRQIRADHSGHLVHLDQPELVAGAVREVLHEACRRTVAGVTPGTLIGNC